MGSWIRLTGERDLVICAGAFKFPLTGSAACPGSLAGLVVSWRRVACGCFGCGDRVRAGQAARTGGPQAAWTGPAIGLRGPVLRQVQGQVAAALAGSAGGDVDQVTADGGAASSPRW